VLLRPGLRVAVAPRFRVALGEGRLALCPGAAERDGVLTPRPGWRPPTPEERALLEGDGPPGEALALFALPEHLLALWSAASPDEEDGLRRFLSETADFLTFKRLPLPPRFALDVVLSAAAPGGPELGPPGPLAAVNLGDAPSAVVFPNLTPTSASLLLAEREAGPAEGAADAARRLLTEGEGYPLVRLLLGPGEGAWLPAGLLLVGLGAGGPDADLRLTVRAEA
jgi:hypothetical protein